MSDVWDGGMLVFDNGYHHDPRASRIVEYAVDTEARTVTRGFTFDSETEEFNALLGDGRRLPNGNILVSWTLQGVLTELTRDGDVGWRNSVDLGTATGRLAYSENVYDGLTGP